MESNKLLLPFFGAALLIVLLGCTGPTFTRQNHDPVMTTEKMEVELERVNQLNLTVGSEDFDPGDYPAFVGIDVRNGRTLINKFFCWDGCPEMGKVSMVYQGVVTEEDCFYAIGTPIISPVPIPGAYWGCQPILDWLTVPVSRPN